MCALELACWCRWRSPSARCWFAVAALSSIRGWNGSCSPMYAENLYFQSSSSVGSPGMDAIGVPVAIAVAGVLLRFFQYWHQDLCSSVALVCCSCSCSVRCVVSLCCLELSWIGIQDHCSTTM